MPIYLYEIIETGETFEQLQRLSDAPLTIDPRTGLAVRRLVTAPNLPLKHGDGPERAKFADNNLARNGFTKYVKAAPGHYVKTVGDPAAPAEVRA